MEHIDLDSFLRQAPPFRFVHRVDFDADDGEGVIRSEYRYAGDEAFFAGHFPGDPIVPGVILVESMAQTCRAWLNWRLGKKAGGFIAAIERAKLSKPVRPGDLVEIESRSLSSLKDEPTSARFCRFSCISRCWTEEVARASITLHQSI